jgi:hypothetical protein
VGTVCSYEVSSPEAIRAYAKRIDLAGGEIIPTPEVVQPGHFRTRLPRTRLGTVSRHVPREQVPDWSAPDGMGVPNV